MRQFLMVALAAAAALLGTALPTLADTNIPDIGPHRHFIVQNGVLGAEIGPRLCDNPKLQNAFNQFHVNVHQHHQAGQGQAAPGLHNGSGPEITARGC